MPNEQIIQEIQLNQVYKISRRTPSYESIRPSLMAQGGGSVDVYIRDTEPSSIAEMKEIQDKQEIKSQPFAVLHPYLYIEQNTAPITKLTLIGIFAEEVEVP